MKATSLFATFVAAKVLVLAGRDDAWSVWSPLAYLWQDVLAALLFAGLDSLLRRRPWAGWALYGIVVGYTAINVAVARVLSTPLTWPLLRAARGTLADSIVHYVTPGNVLGIAAVLAVAALVPWALTRRRRPLLRRFQCMAVAATAILLPLGPVASRHVRTAGLDRNCLLVLVSTALPRIAARDAPGDWRVSPFGQLPGPDLAHLRGTAAGMNVLVVHLESTAAGHLRPYGASINAMPNLTRLTERGLLFENTYTTYPETIRSFLAAQSSVHAALDMAPGNYAGWSGPALAAELGRHGYRTGLFHSGRFAYLGMDGAVAAQGYDVAQDAGVIGGRHESSFGIDETSTVTRLLGWIDEAPRATPFLASYLPIAGHHPYETQAPGPFAERCDIDRYHNALHEADTALGQLLDGLRKRDLEDRTLVVVFGDHGEAFDEHLGNIGHTLALFEENVRVPLVFVAGRRLSGPLRSRRIASLVEVSPTIFDLLGLPVPLGVEGESLLRPDAPLALFATDYSLGLLGLRDGRWKCIHEIEADRTALYDLETDPREQHDLATELPERAQTYREHLLGWAAAAKYRATHRIAGDHVASSP